jgi:DNA-binding response OmpR family regulator
MTNKQTKILVVEDNPGDTRLICEFLTEVEDSAIEMIFADKLSAALECLEENEFDVILLDLGLPDSQGLDTFISIYNQVAETPIIILSCNMDVDIAINSLQRGAQDYLVKGDFNNKLLQRAVRYALERHKINIELKKKIQEVSYHRALIQIIIEKNADGLIVLNQKGVVRFVNPAATEILNRSEKDMLNQVIDFPLVKNSTEFEIFHKGGENRYVELRVAEINWEGESSYLMAIRDITERKKIEETLRESEERMKAEYKGMPLPTITWEKRANNFI